MFEPRWTQGVSLILINHTMIIKFQGDHEITKETHYSYEKKSLLESREKIAAEVKRKCSSKNGKFLEFLNCICLALLQTQCWQCTCFSFQYHPERVRSKCKTEVSCLHGYFIDLLYYNNTCWHLVPSWLIWVLGYLGKTQSIVSLPPDVHKVRGKSYDWLFLLLI